MSQKSYNVQALRGHDYTDSAFQLDMAEAGINIPDELLYTPRINNFVTEKIYEQNIQDYQNVENPFTGQKYTPAEAKSKANELRQGALDNIDTLMKLQ